MNVKFYKEDVAWHEAGHAVVAVHLHLPFSKVWITTAKSLRNGAFWGAVEQDTSGHMVSFKAYTQRRNSEGGIFFVNVDPKKKVREFWEKQIMLICAGEAADGLRPSLSDPVLAKNSTKKDRELIQEIQKRHGISDERVEQLRRRTELLVRKPEIREAIHDTALDLMLAKDGVLLPKIVRRNYRVAREIWAGIPRGG